MEAKVEITESRGGEVREITDIDLAAVLRYFGFTLLPAKTSQKSRKRGRKLTVYRFFTEHPEKAHNFDELIQSFNNDQLECRPRALLAESRHLRNMAHHRDMSNV